MIRPVFAEIAGSWPSLLSRAQMSAVRRSCQTMARCTACPVARSHTTVVSRWLVMPIAAMSFAVTPAFCKASRQVEMVEVQMSSGSCSTQPEAGKCCGNSACAFAAMEMSPRNTIAREEVVPWSMARTKDMEAPLGFAGRFLGVSREGSLCRAKGSGLGREGQEGLSCRPGEGRDPYRVIHRLRTKAIHHDQNSSNH